jgi:hypothetical protein
MGGDPDEHCEGRVARGIAGFGLGAFGPAGEKRSEGDTERKHAKCNANSTLYRNYSEYGDAARRIKEKPGFSGLNPGFIRGTQI